MVVDAKKYIADFDRQMEPYKRYPLPARQRAYDRYYTDFKNYLNERQVPDVEQQKIMSEFAIVEPRVNEPVFKYAVGDRLNDLMVGTGDFVKNLLSVVPEETPYVGQTIGDLKDVVKANTQAWKDDYSPRYKLEQVLSGQTGRVYPSATISSVVQQIPKYLTLAAGVPYAIGLNAAAGVGEVLDYGGTNPLSLLVGGGLGALDGFRPEMGVKGLSKEVIKQIGQNTAQDKNVKLSVGEW